MSGIKHDSGKVRMDLIPAKAELELAKVLTFGAKKYAPNNWRNVSNASERYMAAALRHINAHRRGDELDDETGLPHLAHAMCCLAFMIELADCDTRWKDGAVRMDNIGLNGGEGLHYE